MNKKTTYVAQAGMIAAVYAAATLITMFLLQGLAWGPIQFRISEAVCVLAVLTPAAVPGLTIGCVIANLVSLAINGTGALGLLDVVFGSLATCVGRCGAGSSAAARRLRFWAPCWQTRSSFRHTLPILLQGLGFYTIPFTDISLDGAIFPCICSGVATGIGEASCRLWRWVCRCLRRLKSIRYS